MAEWGQTFNLGDLLTSVERIKTLRASQTYLDAKAQQDLEEKRALESKTAKQAADSLFKLRQGMAADIARRARSEGLTGEALNQRIMELQPAYAKAYEPVAGPWQTMDPEQVLALGGADPLAEKANETFQTELARQKAQAQFRTPQLPTQVTGYPGYQLGPKGAERIPGLPDDQARMDAELQQKLKLEEAQRANQIAVKQAPTYAEQNPSMVQRPLTESQERSRMLSQVGRQGQQAMMEIMRKGYDPTNIIRGGFDRATAGGPLNAAASDLGQAYKSAGNAIVSSILYKMSGAQATKDEIEKQAGIYLPMPGDSEEQKQQKLDFIENTLSSMEGGVPGNSVPSATIAPSPLQRPSLSDLRLPPGAVRLPDGSIRMPNGKRYAP